MGGRGSSSGGGGGGAALGTLSKREYMLSTGNAPGLSSTNGELKHITLYHGSFADFTEFNYEKGKQNKPGGADQYGEGFYFTDSPERARAFGNKIYTVDVAYSTNAFVAKRTGREKDFSYNPDTGYWVIPKSKASHLKIKKKKKVN